MHFTTPGSYAICYRKCVVIVTVQNEGTVECQLSELQSFERVGQPNGLLKSIMYSVLDFSMV